MNAVFLLVTSACLAGQVADKKMAAPPPAAPAPVVASSCGGSCGSGCGGCDSCCEEGFGHRLRERMKGLFHRDCCECREPVTCCKPTCAPACAPTCAPACAPTCAPACAPACNTCDTCKTHWTWKSSCHTSCAPTCNTCSTCDSCCKEGLFARLKGMFHRKDCGCDGGCSTGCCGSTGMTGTVIPPVAPGEKIDAPKKMPAVTPPPPPAKKQEVQYYNNQPGAIPPITVQPSVITTPAVISPSAIPNVPMTPNTEVAPRGDGDRRDPF